MTSKLMKMLSELPSNFSFICRANFTPLLENNQPLSFVLDIEDNKFNKVGNLKVKAFWT